MTNFDFSILAQSSIKNSQLPSQPHTSPMPVYVHVLLWWWQMGSRGRVGGTEPAVDEDGWRIRLAYFPMLLLRGTVLFPLWRSGLLSVCLAEWFHMDQHISATSGAAERGDKRVRGRTRVFTATTHYCIRVLVSTGRPGTVLCPGQRLV